jgi:hypothetical protein
MDGWPRHARRQSHAERREHVIPYVLLTVAALVGLFGVAKVSRSRTAYPHGTPWRSLLLWAVLLSAGLSIWLLSAHIH